MIVEQAILIDRAAAETAGDTEEAFCMDERSFREFYARTAGKLRGYLAKVSGNPDLADDLLQETYFRFLRAESAPLNEAHRKNYLFRIATNLLRDHFRRAKRARILPAENLPANDGIADRVQLRQDLSRLLNALKPRDRELVWLAYVEGASHREMAEITGLKPSSIRPLLFRARHRLADLLRKQGFRPALAGKETS